MRRVYAHGCSCALILLAAAACGGGGGSSGGAPASSGAAAMAPATFSVTGSVGITGQVELDGDVNDPLAADVPNDDLATAQRISNPVQVAGHADAATDARDLFSALLRAGDRIDLYLEGDGVADDLDLALLRTDGSAAASAVQNAERETLQVAAEGEYLIEITAFSGGGNYVLEITPSANPIVPAHAEFVPGEVLVRFVTDEGAGAMPTRVSSMGLDWEGGAPGDTVRVSCSDMAQRATVFHNLGMPHLLGDDPGVRRLPPREQLRRDTPRIAKALSRRADVRSADLNYIRHTFAEPTDEFYPLQWHYTQIGLAGAWDFALPQSGVVVAVIDTGVANHPELLGQLAPGGYDFIQNPAISNDGDGCDADPTDPGDSLVPGESSYHGTHVAGTLAARASFQADDDMAGGAGVAWNARIMPLRAVGVGGGTDFDLIQAILYAAGFANDCNVAPGPPVDVVNMSLGGPGNSQALRDAVDLARAQGVILVASAGNDNTDTPMYPAALPGVISVSATDISRVKAVYSNFGSTIDVAAPGGDNSTDLNNDGFADGVLSLGVDDSQDPPQYYYLFQNGTSMAAPHVAGVFALMRGVHPGLTPADVDTLLAAGALTTDLGNPAFYGRGLIDAEAAVRAAFDAAGVGVPPVPASLAVDPANLAFAAPQNELELTATNAGDADPAFALGSVTAETDDGGAWLVVTPNGVTADGLGRYRVAVDRTGIFGPVVLTGRIVFDSTANDLVVPVTVDVPAPPAIDADAGPLHVLVLDPATGATLQAVQLPSAQGIYDFRFDALEPRNYWIIAGTDRDGDGRICDPGEACGGFPSLDGRVELTVDADRSGIDFDVSLTYGDASDTATSYSATPAP